MLILEEEFKEDNITILDTGLSQYYPTQVEQRPTTGQDKELY